MPWGSKAYGNALDAVYAKAIMNAVHDGAIMAAVYARAIMAAAHAEAIIGWPKAWSASAACQGGFIFRPFWKILEAPRPFQGVIFRAILDDL